MTDVTIRALEIADWEDLAKIWLAPKCQWATLQMPYQSRDAIKTKVENPPPGFRGLVAVVPDNQEVVGMLGLHPGRDRRAHAAELGMCVRDDYQNQGIGSALMEAAIDLAENWLNLKRLELMVYTDNASAIYLYEKYRFEVEGTLRKYAFRNGAYVDVYVMARIRD